MPTTIIAVTGAEGQLGRTIRKIAPEYPGREFLFLSRKDLPLGDPDAINSFFSHHRVDVCINCAAYTAVDKAESDRENAEMINGTAPGILATALAKQGAALVQLSTDYVFDGNRDQPLTEEEPTRPVNFYGLSKLMGEKAAMENNPRAIVLRTSWLYSAFGHNFVKTMIRLMEEKESVSVVNDQQGSPTYATDLAGAILVMIDSGITGGEIYHYSNEGVATWYEFAQAIKTRIGSNCILQPVGSENYPTPARRPKYSLLDKSKIKRIYGIHIPAWDQSLSDCIDELKKIQM
jgi:dTDP-4-dehydrorhamnose reductase